VIFRSRLARVNTEFFKPAEFPAASGTIGVNYRLSLMSQCKFFSALVSDMEEYDEP
jgi:hypothetical protein